VNIKLHITANSDIGSTRELNEDMLLISSKTIRDRSLQETVAINVGASPLCFAVADGIGGANAGEVASEFVVDALRSTTSDLPAALGQEELKRWLKHSALTINNNMVESANKRPELRGMGTTLTALILYEENFYYVHAGDSRLYVLRDGILRQITKDHSLREKTGNTNLPANLIYNSFGAGDNFFVDVGTVSSKISDGDKILLCSDGLTDAVTDELLVSALHCDSPEEDLVRLALSQGSNDNISYILISLEISD